MRQAISELRQLHDGEPAPAPAAAAAAEEEEEAEEGAEDEAALLQELLQKRAELQRMQAAIQQQVEMRATKLEEAKEEYKRKGQETREAIEGQKNQIKELQQRVKSEVAKTAAARAEEREAAAKAVAAAEAAAVLKVAAAAEAAAKAVAINEAAGSHYFAAAEAAAAKKIAAAEAAAAEAVAVAEAGATQAAANAAQAVAAAEAAAAQALAQAVQSVRGQLEEKLEVTLSAKNAQIDALRLELNQATRSAQAETLRLELSQTTQIDALRLELAQAEARHASASRLLEARVVQVMEDAAYEVASMRALVDAAHSDARESVKLGLLEAQEAALRLARQLDVALGRAPLAEAELITQFERANAALLMPAGSGHAFLAHQSHPALVHKIGKENDEGDGLPDTLVFQSMKATRLTQRRASLDFEAEGVPNESVVAAAISNTAAASADTDPASAGPSPAWSAAAADRLRSETVDAQPSGLNLPSARAIDWGEPSDDDEVGDEAHSHATQKKNATRLGDLEAAQIELAQRNATRLADAQAARIEATWTAQRNAERITIAAQRNAARMSELRAALAQAVEAEDYDRAAELQPQIHELRLATIDLATREGAAVAATAPPAAASSAAGVNVATVADGNVVSKPKPLDKPPVQTRSTFDHGPQQRQGAGLALQSMD